MKLTLKDIPLYLDFIENTKVKFLNNQKVGKNINDLVIKERGSKLELDDIIEKIKEKEVEVYVTFDPFAEFNNYNVQRKLITMNRLDGHLLVHELTHFIQDSIFNLACNFKREFYLRYCVNEICAEAIAYLTTNSNKICAKMYCSYWLKMALEFGEMSEFTKEQIINTIEKRLNEQYEIIQQILK